VDALDEKLLKSIRPRTVLKLDRLIERQTMKQDMIGIATVN